jgi:hypothetical protein
MTGFIDTLYTPLRTTINYSSIADLHTYISPLNTLSCSQSSLVVSGQRIHNSLIVTAAHMKSSFHSLILLLPFLLDCRFRRL